MSTFDTVNPGVYWVYQMHNRSMWVDQWTYVVGQVPSRSFSMDIQTFFQMSDQQARFEAMERFRQGVRTWPEMSHRYIKRVVTEEVEDEYKGSGKVIKPRSKGTSPYRYDSLGLPIPPEGEVDS